MQNSLRSFFLGLGLLFLVVFIGGCEKNLNIPLDNDRIDAVTLDFVDTLTPLVSTVILPHIPTSGTGTLLLGGIENESYGSVKSSPYFRIDLADYNKKLPEGSRYDSLELVLKPSNAGYFYGDTTKLQKVSVYRLKEELKQTTLTAGDGIFYREVPIYGRAPAIFGDQKFEHYPEPLGQKAYRASRNPANLLTIRLDDVLGRDLFNKLANHAWEVSSSQNFIQYFHGLVIFPEEQSKAVIAYSDTVRTILHYSFIGSDGMKQSASREFILKEKNFQFNRIESDRIGSAFENLKVSQPVPFEASNYQSYLQGSSGVGVKIDFKYLQQFISNPDLTANKIELEIEILDKNPGNFAPPMYPALFIVDENNVPVDYVSEAFLRDFQKPVYTPGNNTDQNPKITYNLIKLSEKIKAGEFENRSLVLAENGMSAVYNLGNQQKMVATSLYDRLNTMMIASQNNKPKIKLNIFFTNFK